MNRRTIIQTVITAFSGSAIASSKAAKPAANKLLLLKTELAGFQFHSGEEIFQQLEIDAPLILKREAQNMFDTNAVEVYWQEHKLGYIPRTDNVTVAQMMDRGEFVTAQINQVQFSGDPWKRVGLGVFYNW